MIEMGLMTGFAAVVVAALLLAECTEVAPWLAGRIVRRAARQLPAQHQEGYLKEWLANLEDTPGKLTKLAHALGMWCWAWVMGRALRRGEQVARYAVASLPPSPTRWSSGLLVAEFGGVGQNLPGAQPKSISVTPADFGSNPSGQMLVSSAVAPVRSASSRIARGRSAPASWAPRRLAPRRLARTWRLASFL